MAALTVASIPRAIEDEPKRHRWARMFRDPAAVLGLAIVTLVAVCAIFAPLLTHIDPNLQDLSATFVPPGSHGHALGTDNLGRDVLARILWGSRISAIVGVCVVLIGGTIGIALGLIGGYFGGWLDALIGRVADVQLAFPLVLLAVAIVGVVGPGVVTVIAVIGLTSWVQYVRVIRAETLSLRERDFVAAAVASGASRRRVILRHLLPNVASPAIVLATFEIARAVVLESSLSFLGLGVPPTIPSWGGMLADGRQYLDTAWWIGTLPGLAIVTAVMGVNLLGDGLRDALDPNAR